LWFVDVPQPPSDPKKPPIDAKTSVVSLDCIRSDDGSWHSANRI